MALFISASATVAKAECKLVIGVITDSGFIECVSNRGIWLGTIQQNAREYLTGEWSHDCQSQNRASYESDAEGGLNTVSKRFDEKTGQLISTAYTKFYDARIDGDTMYTNKRITKTIDKDGKDTMIGDDGRPRKLLYIASAQKLIGNNKMKISDATMVIIFTNTDDVVVKDEIKDGKTVKDNIDTPIIAKCTPRSK